MVVAPVHGGAGGADDLGAEVEGQQLREIEAGLVARELLEHRPELEAQLVEQGGDAVQAFRAVVQRDLAQRRAEGERALRQRAGAAGVQVMRRPLVQLLTHP